MKTPCSAFALALPLALLPVVQEPTDDGLSQEQLEALSERIKGQIEELRGQEFVRPVAVSATDREGFMEYAHARLDATTTPQDIEAEQFLASLLGAIPADMDLLETTLQVLEEQVGGFYDPGTNAFYLMSSFDGKVAEVILAHELTHALDDQLYDIDGHVTRLEGNTDAQLAFHSVVEGSGTTAMTQWTLARVKAGELTLADLANVPGMDSPALAEAPPYVWKPLISTYLRGASFLVRSDSVMAGQMKAPTAEDIHQAFTHPPRSTEQVLHPEKYWDEAMRDEPRQVVVHAEGLPEGWSVHNRDTLGELGLALLTWPLDDRAGLDMENPMAVVNMSFTNEAAAGWGGDRWVLLGNDSARLVHVVTLWDDAQQAGEFREALTSLSGHMADAARHVAQEIGLNLDFGFRIHASQKPDEVVFSSWAGVGESDLEAILDALSYEELVPEPEQPAMPDAPL